MDVTAGTDNESPGVSEGDSGTNWFVSMDVTASTDNESPGVSKGDSGTNWFVSMDITAGTDNEGPGVSKGDSGRSWFVSNVGWIVPTCIVVAALVVLALKYEEVKGFCQNHLPCSKKDDLSDSSFAQMDFPDEEYLDVW